MPLSDDDDVERDRRVEVARTALREAGLRAHVACAFGNPQRKIVEVAYPEPIGDDLTLKIKADRDRENGGEWSYLPTGGSRRPRICNADDLPALVAWASRMVNPPYGAAHLDRGEASPCL